MSTSPDATTPTQPLALALAWDERRRGQVMARAALGGGAMRLFVYLVGMCYQARVKLPHGGTRVGVLLYTSREAQAQAESMARSYLQDRCAGVAEMLAQLQPKGGA